MTTTRVERHLDASPERVYHALLDPVLVQRWMVPEGMTSHLHAFEAVAGGRFHISLTYDEPTGTGETTAQTDTFQGTFVRLVRDREVVQRVEFEGDDPALRGEMTITYSLTEVGDGTDFVSTQEGLPDGVSPEDNELGWRMSIDRLAALVEHRRR